MVKVQGQRFGYRSTDLERRVKAGDRTAILPAVLLYCSMYHDIPMPKWLKRAFIDAFCSGDSGEAGSWDKVFGRPRTKTQFVRMWRQMDAAENVWTLVAKAKADGIPVNDDLFAKVGKELGIGGKTLVKELYREMVDFKGAVP
jgi:hypothetical protein